MSILLKDKVEECIARDPVRASITREVTNAIGGYVGDIQRHLLSLGAPDVAAATMLWTALRRVADEVECDVIEDTVRAGQQETKQQ